MLLCLTGFPRVDSAELRVHHSELFEAPAAKAAPAPVAAGPASNVWLLAAPTSSIMYIPQCVDGSGLVFNLSSACAATIPVVNGAQKSAKCDYCSNLIAARSLSSRLCNSTYGNYAVCTIEYGLCEMYTPCSVNVSVTNGTSTLAIGSSGPF